MIGERLKQARELNQWTQEELARRVDVTQATIALIERDALAPREELILALAAETGFPREFFSLPVNVDFPLGSLIYRKFARMRSEHKKQSHRLAQQAFELAEFLASRLRPITVGLPRGLNASPVVAAAMVRNALGVDATSPIKNLVHRLERIGVRVFTLPEEVPDLDAFSVLIDGKPIVVLNANRSGDRQMFSVAHEIGHLVLHYPLTSEQDQIEKEANKFAAELLMPQEAMRDELVAPVTLSSLAELKARWRVSMQALLQRAKDLRVISDRQFKYLRMQMGKKQWLQQEPVEIPAEKPRWLRKMAEVAYGENFNIRRIARDAHRPPFLVARLLDAPTSASAGRVLGFPKAGDEETAAAELA